MPSSRSSKSGPDAIWDRGAYIDSQVDKATGTKKKKKKGRGWEEVTDKIKKAADKIASGNF